jgi:hypothetical protein
MKKVLLILLGLLTMAQISFAALPITEANMQSAMLYGITRSNKAEFPDAVFLKPWTIAESAKTNPYRYNEKVVLYTPYMLAALDARTLTANKQKFSLSDIQQFVKEYDGITVIGATVNTPVLLKTTDFHVTLVQGTTTLIPYASELLLAKYLQLPAMKTGSKAAIAAKMASLQAEDAKLKSQLVDLEKDKLDPNAVTTNVKAKTPVPTTKIARLDMQFYFENSKFDVAKPFQIQISDEYGGKRLFNVNPDALK